jgi:RNA polymerase sigma factor (TIGR02999 family)
MRGEREGHTLQSTALVNEAFMRLGEQRNVQWESKGQFSGCMSTLMRRILVDHARSRNAAKRGLGVAAQSLDVMQEEAGEEIQISHNSDEWLSLLNLDRALTRLEELDPRQGRVVELRFFGGLSVEQTAEALDISSATVIHEWAMARAWLKRQLGDF